MEKPPSLDELTDLLFSIHEAAPISRIQVNENTDLFACGLLSSLEVFRFVDKLEQMYSLEIDGFQVVARNFKTLRAVQDFLAHFNNKADS